MCSDGRQRACASEEDNEEVETMGSTDEAKGRVKQAAGDLADDKDLKREGKIDEAGGKAKGKANELVDKVADGLKKGD
jgi:uncharacterized protein YjbJ (UPF0337 family)